MMAIIGHSIELFNIIIMIHLELLFLASLFEVAIITWPIIDKTLQPFVDIHFVFALH